MSIKIFVPIIRGVLEILIAIWLIYDWQNIPNFVVWIVVLGTFILGVGSILEGVELEND